MSENSLFQQHELSRMYKTQNFPCFNNCFQPGPVRPGRRTEGGKEREPSDPASKTLSGREMAGGGRGRRRQSLGSKSGRKEGSVDIFPY